MKTFSLIALIAATATAIPSSINPSLFNRSTSESTTTIKLGSKTIKYGTVNPTDVMKSLTKACTGGMCDTTPYELNTELASGGTKLKLTPEGVVAPADLALFVNAMVAAVTKGTVTDKETWCNQGVNNSPAICTTKSINKQANYVGIERRNADNLIEGFMGVRVELETQDDQWCSVALSLATTIVSAVDSIAGGLLGAIVGPVCDNLTS